MLSPKEYFCIYSAIHIELMQNCCKERYYAKIIFKDENLQCKINTIHDTHLFKKINTCNKYNCND